MEIFCTAGRGTELFVEKELYNSFNEYLIKVCITDGKVFFTINDACTDVGDRVNRLKMVERLFVNVLSQEKQSVIDKRQLLTLLHTKLNDKTSWEKAIGVLQRVRKTTPVTHPDTKDTAKPYYRDKVDFCKNKICNLVKRPRSESLSMPETNDTFCEHESSPYIDSTDLKRKYRAVSYSKMNESTRKKMCTINNELEGQQQRAESHCKMEVQTRKTFRVSCKFSGSVRHKLNIQRTVKQMGVLVSKLMGWRTDLKHPNIEICIHMNDDRLVVGIPVFKEPLSRRWYIKHHGLRSTVCRIMTDLAHIEPGDVILDPMCGKATILMEAAHSLKDAFYLGVDIEQSQVKLAEENIHYRANFSQERIQIILGNALNLPLPDNSINKIITDAPFGHNHQVKTDLYIFYLKMLTEACRVLRGDGFIVLLTSNEIKHFILTDLLCTENRTTDAIHQSETKDQVLGKEQSICEPNLCSEQSISEFVKDHQQIIYGFNPDSKDGKCDRDQGSSICELNHDREQSISELNQDRERSTSICELNQDKEQSICELNQDREQSIRELNQDREQRLSEPNQDKEQGKCELNSSSTDVFLNKHNDTADKPCGDASKANCESGDNEHCEYTCQCKTSEEITEKMKSEQDTVNTTWSQTWPHAAKLLYNGGSCSMVENLKSKLIVTKDFYLKLGTTDGYVIVMKKT